MGSSTSQLYSSKQTIKNEVIQVSSEVCVHSCTNKIINFSFYAEGSTFNNLELGQKCDIRGSTCVLKNLMDSKIKNVLESTSKQSITKSGGLFSFMDAFTTDSNTSSINIDQQFYNSVTQINNETCQTTADNEEVNINFVFIDSNVTGNLDLGSQVGSISDSDCHLDNTTKNVISNDGTGSGDQSFTKKNIISMIITAIVVLIALLMIFKIIFKDRNKDNKEGNISVIV